MYYNIDTFHLVTSKDFYLDLDSPCDTEGYLELDSLEVLGRTKENKIYITGFSFLTDDTGWVFREKLLPLLQDTKGLAYFLEIWEGGSLLNIRQVKNGQSTIQDLQSFLEQKLPW